MNSMTSFAIGVALGCGVFTTFALMSICRTLVRIREELELLRAGDKTPDEDHYTPRMHGCLEERTEQNV